MIKHCFFISSYHQNRFLLRRVLMFCMKCGSDNLEDAKFCRTCGEPLTEKTDAGYVPVFKPLPVSDNESVEPAAESAQQPEAALPRQSAAVNMPLTAVVLPKKKSSKKLLIILTSVLLVLAILCAAGFLLRNQIIKKVMPEQYLQMSLARSAAQSQKGAGQLLDLSQYATGAVKHEFTFEQSDEYSDFLVDGNYMYDAASEKALLDVSIESSGVSLNDNILYISGDQIALSVPSQITDTDFLTIDPATFDEEWKDKGYDELAAIPDLQKIINAFFGKTEEGTAVNASDMNDDFMKYLTDEAEFSTDGTVTEKIGGVDRKLDVMKYTISKSSANKSIQSFIDDIREEMSKSIEDYASDASLGVSDYFDALESIKIKDDITINFYIDQDGYISRIEVEEIKIEANEETGEIGFVFDTWREDGTTYTSTEITSDSESDSSTLNIDSETALKDGVYTFSWELSSPDASSDTSISIDMEWDTKDKKGENLSIVFEEDTGYSGNEATLTGNLVEDKSKISLSDATIELISGSDTVYTVDFSYSLSKIDASEITVDTSDSTPLLDYEPFTDYMDSMLAYGYNY